VVILRFRRRKEADFCPEDALIRQNACLSMGQPGRHALNEMRKFVGQTKPLVGSQDINWLNNAEELVCLKPRADPDRLYQFLRNLMGPYLGWFGKVNSNTTRDPSIS